MCELEVSKAVNYTSHMMIDDFPEVLSTCAEAPILAGMHNSSAVSILCDESTNLGNIKQLIVFGRYLVQGSPKTQFLKVVNLQDGKADSIE